MFIRTSVNLCIAFNYHSSIVLITFTNIPKTNRGRNKKRRKAETDPSENNGAVWGWKGNFSMTWKTAGLE